MFNIMSCDEQWMGILSPLDVIVSCREALSRMSLCTDKKYIYSSANWAMCVTDWKCAVHFLCAVDAASGADGRIAIHSMCVMSPNPRCLCNYHLVADLVLFELNNNSYNCVVYSLFSFVTKTSPPIIEFFFLLFYCCCHYWALIFYIN